MKKFHLLNYDIIYLLVRLIKLIIYQVETIVSLVKVKKGKQLGSELGFPTANLTLDEEVFLPTFGVYYGVVEVDKKRFNCIVNVGLNPTVDDEDSVKIEAHILNFNDDIYHKEIKLFLKNFIRDEQKFENIDELKIQVLDDIESVKKYI